MRVAYLLSTILVLTAVNAERHVLAGLADPYGIMMAAALGNESAAVSGFVKAGTAQDSTSIVAALEQIFDTVVGTPNKAPGNYFRLDRMMRAGPYYIVHLLSVFAIARLGYPQYYSCPVHRDHLLCNAAIGFQIHNARMSVNAQHLQALCCTRSHMTAQCG